MKTQDAALTLKRLLDQISAHPIGNTLISPSLLANWASHKAQNDDAYHQFQAVSAHSETVPVQNREQKRRRSAYFFAFFIGKAARPKPPGNPRRYWVSLAAGVLFSCAEALTPSHSVG